MNRPIQIHPSTRPAAGIFRLRSIAWHLRLLVLAALVPMLCALGLGIHTHFTRDWAASEQVMVGYAQFVADDAQRFMARVRGVLGQAVLRPQVRALDAAHCDPALPVLGFFFPAQSARLLTLDAQGQLVCPGAPDADAHAARSESAAVPDYVIQARATGQLATGRSGPSSLNGPPVITAALPIKGDAGEFRGVVALAFNELRFPGVRVDSAWAGSIVSGLFNAQGALISKEPDARVWPVSSLTTLRSVQWPPMSDSQLLSRVDPDGVERIYALRKVPGTDWTAFAAVPTAKLYERGRQELVAALLMVGVAAMLATWLAWRVGRRIGLSIEAIAAGIRRASGGDLSVRLQPAGTSETAEMASTFNAVIEARDAAERRRKQADDALRTVKAIVDSSDDAIIGKTLGGIITSWNPGAQRMFGYTAQDVVGKPLLMLIPRERQHEEPRLLARIARGERVRHFETVRRRKDGSLIDISVTLSPIVDETGRIVGVSKIARDISERKRAEQALRALNDSLEARIEERTRDLLVAKEAAETANRAKMAFLANMSHELRTPINGMIGMTEMVKRKLTDTRQVNRLGKALASARHLLAIIDDILDITRIEANQLKLDDVEFRLQEVLENVCAKVHPAADAKGVALVCDIPPDLKERVLRGDPVRLAQVIVNLVDNAIKFTPAGTVITRIAVLAEESEVDLIRVEVLDTGVGIDARHQSRIFSAFEQVDASARRGLPGTGLGLAICKQLVISMGGEIGVRSEPGAGSMFWFTARLRQATPAHIV